MAGLEARAGSLEASIEKQVKARSGKLEERAGKLCPRLTALEKLQQQGEFRLADGAPLQLITLKDTSAKPAKAASASSP